MNCFLADKDVESARIKDDGSGLPIKVKARNNVSNPNLGVGLKSMVNRAELMGGELQVRPRPGGGTIVSLNVPNKVA